MLTLPDDTAVLVPRRADFGRRDAIWKLLQDRIWPGVVLTEGHHEHGPFNRAAALNAAARTAGDWAYAVIADSDSFVPDGQLLGALELARRSGLMVIAHSRWVNVDVDETEQLMSAGWLEHRDDRTIYNFTVSSMLVVPRPVWDAVGGFDESFAGWGREDQAFCRAVKILTAPPLRVDGPVFHLAHDRPSADIERVSSPEYIANTRLWGRYLAARTPDQMRELLAESRVVPA